MRGDGVKGDCLADVAPCVGSEGSCRGAWDSACGGNCGMICGSSRAARIGESAAYRGRNRGAKRTERG